MARPESKAFAALAALAVLFAVGGSDASAEEAKLTSVSLQLPWTMLGAYDAFTLALQRGYYRDQGIELEINEGSGSLVAAQAAATGTADFSLADVSTGALLASKGAKIKSVAVFQPKGGLVITYHDTVKINSFPDVKGLTVIHGANDNATQMFNALLAKYNMNWDDVKSTIVSPTAYEQSFLADGKAVLLGNVYSTYQGIKLKEPSAKGVLYADFGVNVMGVGIFVNDKTLQDRPQIVRGFLAASVKGFEDAVRDPDAAVKSAVEKFPMVVRPQFNRAELLSGLSLLDTPETKGKVIGWSSPQQWEQMVALEQKYAGLQGDQPVSSYFTNDYLPKM